MSRYVKDGTTWKRGVCTLSTCQFWRGGCDIMGDTSGCKRWNTYNEMKKRK